MINMGKRLLLILLSLFICAGSALAYGTPRWFKMPVSVYVSDRDSSAINCFKLWQSVSGGTVRFLFHTSKNTESMSNISIYMVDSLPDDAPYSVERKTTIFGNSDYYEKNGYFYKARIYVAKNGGKDKKAFSTSELRAITLRAIGEVLGIKPYEDANGVMGKEVDFTRTSISGADIKALNKLYKP